MDKIKRTLGFILTHPLGKKHPFRSFLRFLYWQVQTVVFPSGFIIKSFIGQVEFYARKGLTGITGNIYTGLHEFNDMAFLLHLLRPDDVFFDIGANVGAYTLLASGVCHAQSISLEPVAATFHILNKNISLNKLQNKVTSLNCGAAAQQGAITFSVHEDTTNHVIANDESAAQKQTLPVINIDSLLTTHQPCLIKMDVEGYETEVLKGMQETLELPLLKAIIIELNGSGGRYGFDEGVIHDLLLSKGFCPYNYDPFTRKLAELGTYGKYNTIYCRDMPFISERIRTAKAIHIMGEIL